MEGGCVKGSFGRVQRAATGVGCEEKSLSTFGFVTSSVSSRTGASVDRSSAGFGVFRSVLDVTLDVEVITPRGYVALNLSFVHNLN